MYVECGKNTTWTRTKVEYFKIRLWAPSNIIYIEDMILFLSTLYNVRRIFDRNNCNWHILESSVHTNIQTKLNHKTINLSNYINLYIWILYL